jgi:hypothetical protein
MFPIHAPHLRSPVSASGSHDHDATHAEREAVVARVALEAHDLYRHASVPPDVLDRFVREAVEELWPGPLRVTAFVPILALRRVRQKVGDLDGIPS